MVKSSKQVNPGVELMLCIFLGYLGVHRFYAGKKKSGLIYLFTAGILGVGWIADIIILSVKLAKSGRESDKNFERILPNPSRELITEEFCAVGVNYYMDNINKLACRNPDWRCTSAQIIKNGKAEDRIFRYNYIHKPVKLVPEPNNPEDKNAVAVFVAGEQVGYINREENLHVLDILHNREVKYISSFIGGGQYKVIHQNKEISRFEDAIFVKVKVGYI